MTVRSGRLNCRIIVEQATETPDGVNDPVRTWSTYATRWASVEPLNGREFFAAKQEQSEITTRIRMRYDTITRAITAKMRIVYENRIFEIDTILSPAEDREELILMCTERGI